MLKAVSYDPPSELDQQVFDALVPPDHYLRQVKSRVAFDRCRDLLAGCYDPTQGCPAKEPLLLLKLQFLQLHYNLSDREVMAQARVNIAFRFFLDLALTSPLPHPSLLSVFRTRLGPATYQQVFDDILAQARAHGLLKDRLRLKDATHVLANIAVPSTLRLVAQVRQQLLEAARPFEPARVSAEEQRGEAIRAATADLKDDERLLHRVAHLRELVAWADGLLGGVRGRQAADEPARRRLEAALGLAHRVLADREDPDKGDRVVSAVDPDARQGKHGDYFDGYLLDITEDADSELITRLQVLPGNGDEGADAAALLRAEEQAHGNDVAGVSLDRAGFRGDVLRELRDPRGLKVEVTVPPKAEPGPVGCFPPERFALRVLGEEVVLECPAGEQTRRRARNANDTGYKYRFGAKTCAGCRQRVECMGPQARKGGRTVIKNDYEQEYQAARARVGTPAYERVRREHPRVERKLGEVVRWHGGRRARYRGLGRVLVQGLLTAVVVNVKRLVKLLAGQDRAALAVAQG